MGSRVVRVLGLVRSCVEDGPVVGGLVGVFTVRSLVVELTVVSLVVAREVGEGELHV